MRDILDWTARIGPGEYDRFARKVRVLAQRFESKALLDLAEQSLAER
jgi:hypothetical protein